MDFRTLTLIQFGHNDEPGKPGRSTSAEKFRGYMERDVDEAAACTVENILGGSDGWKPAR